MERAEDILAYIPHALGFQPERSVVLLLMVEQKLEATLRVDLPQKHEASDDKPWVWQVCELIERLPGLTSVLCVLYTQNSIIQDKILPWDSLLRSLAAELEQQGTPLRQAWCLSHGQVGDYFSSASDHGSFELNDPALNPTSLRMVVAGSAPLTEPWDGEGVSEWGNAREIRVLADELEGDFLDCLDTWAIVLSTTPFHAEQLIRENPAVPARLIRGLDTRMVRDILPYLAGVGATAAQEAIITMANCPKDEADSELADFLLGRGTHGPEWEEIDHLWFICRDLLGVAQGGRRAALLCLMAWIEWAKGRGSMAMALLRNALKVEPEYRLAQLLEQLLQCGIMPEWATDPKRAWRAKFE